MAGHAVVGLHLGKRRHDLVATLDLREATAGETASRWGIDGRGDVAFEDDALALGGRIDRRDGREQRLGVGRQWVGVQRLLRRDLHHLAEVHHAHAVGHVLHHVQAVRDEQVREAEALLEVVEEVQHLRLDRDVERRHRLVAHDELRVHRQSARDAHALTLAAGELVGVAVAHVVREAHALQKLVNAAFHLVLRQDVVRDDGLGDDVADAHARVERSVGVLEDQLDVLAVALALGAFHGREVVPVEDDRARGGREQVHEHLAHGGLAAARFAHKPERLAAADLEAHVVDGLHVGRGSTEEVRLGGEALGQVAHVEQDVLLGRRASGFDVLAHRLPSSSFPSSSSSASRISSPAKSASAVSTSRAASASATASASASAMAASLFTWPSASS